MPAKAAHLHALPIQQYFITLNLDGAQANAGGIGYAAAAALASSLPQDRRFIFCTSAALIQADPSVVGAVESDELFAGLCVDNSDGGTGRVWNYAEAEQAVRPGIGRKELWMAGGIGVGGACDQVGALRERLCSARRPGWSERTDQDAQL